MAGASLVFQNSAAKVYEKKETRKSEPHKGTDWDKYGDKSRNFYILSGDTLGQLPTIAGFFEVLSGQGKLGLRIGVDKFGFSIVANIGKNDVSLCLERHDTATGIGLTRGIRNSFTDIPPYDVF